MLTPQTNLLDDLPSSNAIRIRLSQSLSEADVLRKLLKAAERREQLLGIVSPERRGAVQCK